MMQGQRYYDEDGEPDTLGMTDVEDYSSDFYEKQPGDAISSSTNHLRSRKKSQCALVVLALGTLLVLGGVIFAILGKEEEYASKQAAAASPSNSPAPASVTLGPTHGSLYDFVVSLVGEHALVNKNSLASRALAWLEETHDPDQFGNARLKQRFSLACLYMSTTHDADWTNDAGWMSESDECNWYGVECKSHKLIALNLTANGLSGLIPWEITFLKDFLVSLELASNDLVNENHELAWMGELKQLRMLDVENTYFSYNGIPPYIGQLSELKILDVADTLFIGELDGSIFESLTQLLYLEIGGNLYNSTLPQEIIDLPHLEAIYAYDCGLTGNVDFLPNLKKIVEIWLDENPDLGGTIPTEIGQLTTMASLSLTNCDMRGQIPSEIGKLTMMEQMWLFGNWFSGTIPSEFADLPKLQILALEDNNITDVSMPKELCDREMVALSSDCDGEYNLVVCSCCTCCEAPCPVANLPVYAGDRLLEVHDEIRRL